MIFAYVDFTWVIFVSDSCQSFFAALLSDTSLYICAIFSVKPAIDSENLCNSTNRSIGFTELSRASCAV